MNWIGGGFIPIIIYPMQTVGEITPIISNFFLLLNAEEFLLLNGNNLKLL